MTPPMTPFLKIAAAAFPTADRAQAIAAGDTLLPFVDASYQVKSAELIVLGRPTRIPKRIHFIQSPDLAQVAQGTAQSMARCLLTRSTDGYQRHAALQSILNVNEPWSIPYVTLLAGEYVVEIVDDILGAIPTLNREQYVNFVRENRPLMKRLRAKATSYWDCYYRNSHPHRTTYPGLVFLHQLENWAS